MKDAALSGPINEAAASAALDLWNMGDSVHDLANAARQANNLLTLARFSYDPTVSRFVSRKVTPTVEVKNTLDDACTYTFAADFAPLPNGSLGVLPGAGIPLVRRRDNLLGLHAHFPPEAIFEAVTLTAKAEMSSDGKLVIHLVAIDAQALPGSTWADASAQAYIHLLGPASTGRKVPSRIAWGGFRNPLKMTAHKDGIYLIEPFDPKRIPLLLIHGLKSGPVIWHDLTFSVLNDPYFHARFQVWHAFYPTGLPPFYSGARIRKALHSIYARFDPENTSVGRRHMAVIGHSMGGIIARLLVTEDRGLMWKSTFTVPTEELAASAGVRREWQEILTLKHEPQIGFVGFINTPHRGSEAANRLVGWVGAAMIKLPEHFQSLFRCGDAFVAQTTAEMRPYVVGSGPSSVRVLAPEYPLTRTLSSLPIVDGIRIASLIGLRGGSESIRDPRQNATDGVVTYNSAHLDQGHEHVIKSGHNAYASRETTGYFLDQLWDWQAEL